MTRPPHNLTLYSRVGIASLISLRQVDFIVLPVAKEKSAPRMDLSFLSVNYQITLEKFTLIVGKV